MITYFKKPISNKIPYKDITLSQLYKAIKGDYYKSVTDYIRSLDTDQYKREKGTLLDFVTFAGTFTSREETGLKCLSGLMCFDFDHIQNIEFLKRNILRDKQIDAQMIFISPGGDGLKVIIKKPSTAENYSSEYESLVKRFWTRYAAKADKTQDIARVCFVCHDPSLWVSEEIKLQKMIEENPNVKELVNRLDLKIDDGRN